jgi:hypothetical protein
MMVAEVEGDEGATTKTNSYLLPSFMWVFCPQEYVIGLICCGQQLPIYCKQCILLKNHSFQQNWNTMVPFCLLY